MVVGELGAIVLAVRMLGVRVSPLLVSPLVLLTIATNLALLYPGDSDERRFRTRSGLVLCFDVLILTVLLHLTGGPNNPFSVLYLVHITSAAMLLGSRWTWALTGLSIVAYGSLFAVQLGAPTAGPHVHHGGGFAEHLRAMWVAFSLTAVVTALFVVRLTSAIAQRDLEIADIRERAARSERLAALATFAAGAAHELGTPLATIAVAAGELDHAVAKLPEPHASRLVDDTTLILGQLARCRGILDEMSATAGDVSGEMPAPVTLRELVDACTAELAPGDAERLRVDVPEEAAVRVPRTAFVRVLRSLVRNALEAGRNGSAVDLRAHVVAGRGCSISVTDRGAGMSADVLARATEPFFTTKPSGRGMGMGLFLANVVARQLGGRLELTSAPGQGTTATLELPDELVELGGENDERA